MAAADAEGGGHLGGVGLRLEGGGQDDHIHDHVVGLVVEGFIPAQHQLAILLLNAAHPAVVQVNALVARVVEEFFIPFAKGAHITVDLVHFSIHIVTHKLGQLERVHAAGAAAVIVVVFVAAANAVHDRHAFRRAAILEAHLPVGRAGGIDQAL